MSAEKGHADEGLQRLLALAVSDDLSIAERRRVDETLRFSAAARIELDAHAACAEALAGVACQPSLVDGRPSLWSRIEPQLGPAGRRRPSRLWPWLSAPRLASACAALVLLHVGLTLGPALSGPGRGVPIAAAGPLSAPALASAGEFFDPCDGQGIVHPVLGGSGARAGDDDPGVRIVQLLEGGALHRAGFLPGDVILRVEGCPVFTPADFAQCLRVRGVGMPMQLVALRDGRPFLVHLRLPARMQLGGNEIEARQLEIDPTAGN